MGKIISGIQQLGIGIPDVMEAWKWYRTNLGFDIKMFEDDGKAELMLPYTGGKPQVRHAVLALNLKGGGGFEIWQYKGRTPQKPDFEVKMGDLGLYIGKINCSDVESTYKIFERNLKGFIVSNIKENPVNEKFFIVKDPYGNLFQIMESKYEFAKVKTYIGGVAGVIIGVSDIDKSKTLYSDILGYDTVVYDKTGVSGDFENLPNGKAEIRRVLLRHAQPRKGALSKVLGPTEIELIQLTKSTGRKIFENRLWGDLGFIHLCFDIRRMDELKSECESKGYKFTVDTGASFDMGEAAGRFSYIEDPDGALIEFVETYKIPILKKIGWFKKLTGKYDETPLPDWMLKMLKLNRVK